MKNNSKVWIKVVQ